MVFFSARCTTSWFRTMTLSIGDISIKSTDLLHLPKKIRTRERLRGQTGSRACSAKKNGCSSATQGQSYHSDSGTSKLFNGWFGRSYWVIFFSCPSAEQECVQATCQIQRSLRWRTCDNKYHQRTTIPSNKRISPTWSLFIHWYLSFKCIYAFIKCHSHFNLAFCILQLHYFCCMDSGENNYCVSCVNWRAGSISGYLNFLYGMDDDLMIDRNGDDIAASVCHKTAYARSPKYVAFIPLCIKIWDKQFLRNT